MKTSSLLCAFIIGACATTSIFAEITNVKAYSVTVPAMINRTYNPILGVQIDTTSLETVSLQFTFQNIQPQHIKRVALYAQGKDFKPGTTPGKCLAEVLGSSVSPQGKLIISIDQPLPQGANKIWLSLEPAPSASIHKPFTVTINNVKTKDATITPTGQTNVTQRIGVAVTRPNQKIVSNDRISKFFRIPGIVRTKKGTLIATFDNRYHNNNDLPADIDVAVSRSTDGGQTWSPIYIAIDQKDVTDLNKGIGLGVGDPTILIDNSNDRIWIAGLAAPKSGHPIWKSVVGTASPEKCGQFILAYSDDDGLTWSEPINITESIKRLDDPDTKEWALLFQGPGNGICMKDGTLVFPAQVWGNLGKAPHHGVLVYSKDNGKTWTSSKQMTFGGSESQVAQLSDGSLMLSTREGNGQFHRAVGTTPDLGETWHKHESMTTEAGRLVSPFCQACLISTTVNDKFMLYYSGPTGRRFNMTVKKSSDDGDTWSAGTLYDERNGMGYSAIIPIDKNNLGILYESQAGYILFLSMPFNEIK